MKFREFLLNEESEKVQAETLNDLIIIIRRAIKENGPNCDLNFIDTSKITNMAGLFFNNFKDFNGDISKWKVSKVKDMRVMFNGSNFSGDISKWKVPKAAKLNCMFYASPLNNKEPDWFKERPASLTMPTGNVIMVR